MQHQPVEEAAERRRDGQTGVNRLPGEDGAEGVAPPRDERAADGAEQVSGNGVGQKAEADAQPVAEVDGSDAAEDDLQRHQHAHHAELLGGQPGAVPPVVGMENGL